MSASSSLFGTVVVVCAVVSSTFVLRPLSACDAV